MESAEGDRINGIAPTNVKFGDRYIRLLLLYWYGSCRHPTFQSSQIYTGTDKIIWLDYIRSKSKIKAKVPLLKPALDLLEKCKLKKGDITRKPAFPLESNQNLNTNLKIISEICELGVSLNFYMTQHTFATTIALLNGVPITSIKEIMGHERIESTMIYIKIHAASIAHHMKRVQEKLDYHKQA